jgi:hypothetical protein
MEVPNIQIHENPSSGRNADTCGWTNRRNDEGDRHFSQLCEFKFQLRHQSGGHTSPYYNFVPNTKIWQESMRLSIKYCRLTSREGGGGVGTFSKFPTAAERQQLWHSEQKLPLGPTTWSRHVECTTQQTLGSVLQLYTWSLVATTGNLTNICQVRILATSWERCILQTAYWPLVRFLMECLLWMWHKPNKG